MGKILKFDNSSTIFNRTSFSKIKTSLFDYFLPLFIKHAIDASGEIYAIKDNNDEFSGIYIYDPIENSGTSFAKDSNTAEEFFLMNLGQIFYSNRRFGDYSGIERINYLKMSELNVKFNFRNRVQIMGISRLDELSNFLEMAYGRINRAWVAAALKYGDKCFVCEMDNKIVGMGWITQYFRRGRLHSLYVDPGYRNISIGMDIALARVYYASQIGLESVISEIPENSVYSQIMANRIGFAQEGMLYMYKR